MPKFAVLRDLPLSPTRADLDGMAMEGLVAQDLYPYCRTEEDDPGIAWVRTYWQPGSNWGMCFYEAPSAEELWEFQTSCGLEAVEIREVTEMQSPTGCDAEGEIAESFCGAELVVMEVPMSRLDQGRPSESGWIRTYWDEERGTAVALYRATDRPGGDRVKKSSRPRRGACRGGGRRLRRDTGLRECAEGHSGDRSHQAV